MEADVLNQILAFLAASVAGYVGYEVHRARESIARLNGNIEVLIVRINDHDKRISHLEDHDYEKRHHDKRISDLEDQI